MIREATTEDVQVIHEIINDAARAYKSVIPSDRWNEPYMPLDELNGQIVEGVTFWCFEENGRVLGVMGIQDKDEVNLIRHAYVRTEVRNKGIGGALLKHLYDHSTKPVLIGTWAAASWAIAFYEKHGFRKVSAAEKDRLLTTYWSIPSRQVETSVVLADARWAEHKERS